jgi:hypothetical protein
MGSRVMEAFSATSSLNPATSTRYLPFMTSPGPDCTSREPENRQVWLNGAMSPHNMETLRVSKVTERGHLQSARGALSFLFQDQK